MFEKEWNWACDAARQLGWLPQTIFSQWVLETNWFKSNNYQMNHNIAGQTWYEGCGYPKGLSRAANEGGLYIKYPDAASGYVDFIKKNVRYAKVKTFTTVQEQVLELKRAGWATDPDYVAKVMSVYRTCLDKGYFNKPVVKAPPPPVVHKSPVSLVDYLKSKGRPTDFESRRKLAYQYKIVSDPRAYSGTAEQNAALLKKLQS
jgi:hypothetical protein